MFLIIRNIVSRGSEVVFANDEWDKISRQPPTETSDLNNRESGKMLMVNHERAVVRNYPNHKTNFSTKTNLRYV